MDGWIIENGKWWDQEGFVPIRSVMNLRGMGVLKLIWRLFFARYREIRAELLLAL